MTKRPWTSAELDEALHRAEGGESIRDIAASSGRNRTNLSRQLRALGLERNGSWSQTLHLPNDPAVLAYIAGIIDGEGSIMFVRRVKDPGGGRCMVRVGMTYRPIIEWLAAFGGKFNFSPRRAENRLDAYTWAVSRRRDVHHLLTSVLPYLIVKREKAEQAIAWCERP
jgi:hypothetical protein